uniref:Predicted protein n=1 Tax=Hordeum vulgare subsp. vulgare TaxID=112509 RepID=F2EBG4_HORVV|nr:predicted protein [Hordeum vulgare subsp. vulgare]
MKRLSLLFDDQGGAFHCNSSFCSSDL